MEAGERVYRANVRLDGDWWMVEVPEVDGLTQAVRFEDVEFAARELVSVITRVPLAQVRVDVVLGPEVAPAARASA